MPVFLLFGLFFYLRTVVLVHVFITVVVVVVVCVCVCLGAQSLHTPHSRGQLSGVSSLLVPPSHGLWGLDSGCRLVQRALLPIEPFLSPPILSFCFSKTGFLNSYGV